MRDRTKVTVAAVLFSLFVASVLVIFHFARIESDTIADAFHSARVKNNTTTDVSETETNVVKRLSDDEIVKLQNKGEVVLCSASGLIPDCTRGEYVIIDEDTNEVKAITSDWSNTEWLMDFGGSSKGYLIALHINYQPSKNDVIYYYETDDVGDITKWCECQRFTMGEKKEDNSFPYEKQLKDYKDAESA